MPNSAFWITLSLLFFYFAVLSLSWYTMPNKTSRYIIKFIDILTLLAIIGLSIAVGMGSIPLFNS
jgi:hypothetical protein